MTATISTTTPTEADLEARINQLIKVALPGLSSAGIKHQLSFSIQFGKKSLTVRTDSASARADILLTKNNTNLAVLELKRETLPLTEEDARQGLSYARVLHPRPPLVILSNGKETRVLETATGEELKPDSITEEKFVSLISAVASMSRSDVNDSISKLMGTDPKFWTAAFRVATDLTLSELTGDRNSNSVFLDGFLLPRVATDQVITSLKENKLVLVQGTPLSGKTHVIRDLVERLKESEDMVVFYISGDHGEDIFQTIADALTGALGFPITRDIARNWLFNVSQSSGPSLILAIDELSTYKAQWVKSVKDLTSTKFGDRLLTVLAVDEGVAERLLKSESGRGPSQLLKRSASINVEPLSDKEFEDALRLLSEFRIGFVRGAHYSHDYRSPWLLRAILSNALQSAESKDESLFAILPSIFGQHMMQEASDQEHHFEIKVALRDTAKAILDEVHDKKRSPDLQIQSLNLFVIRRAILNELLIESDKDKLIELGYIKLAEIGDGEIVYVVRTPEFIASMLTNQISDEIIKRVEDDNLDSYLVELASSLPIGDVIVANAIYKAAIRLEYLPAGLIESLIGRPPKPHNFGPGTKMLLAGPEGKNLKLEILNDGALVAKMDGKTITLSDEEDPELGSNGYSEFHPWLILAHLCHHRMGVESQGGNFISAEAGILLELGKAKMPIRRPEPFDKTRGVLTHDIAKHGSIVCHKIGIVEPITQAIYNLLHREEVFVKSWINAAIDENSFALLARIHLALHVRLQPMGSENPSFLSGLMDEQITPALKKYPPLH